MESQTELIRIQAESVKDLKNQIKELQDELVRLKSAQQDTTNTEAKLTEANRMLNSVMKAGKGETEALAGSYNALSKEMAELKKQWKATADEAERAKLGEKIREINNTLKGYDESVGQFSRNVGNYGSAIDNLGSVLGNVRQVGGDFTNGLMAMTNVLGIATKDNDNYNTGLKVLQGTMAALQGTKGIAGIIGQFNKLITKLKAAKKAQEEENRVEKQATVESKAHAGALKTEEVATEATNKATKALSATLKTLGITALISGLLYIATHLADIGDWLDKIAVKLGIIRRLEGESNAIQNVDDYEKKVKEINDEYDHQVELAKARKDGEEAVYAIEDKRYDALKELNNDAVEGAESYTKELEKQKENAGWLMNITPLFGFRLASVNKKIQEQAELTKKVKEEQESLNTAIERENELRGAKAVGDAKDDEKKKAEDAKRQAEAAQRVIQKAREDAQKLLKEVDESNDTEQEKIEKKFDAIDQKLKGYLGNLKQLGLTEAEVNEAIRVNAEAREKELEKYYGEEIKKAVEKKKEVLSIEEREQKERRALYADTSKKLLDSYEGDKEYADNLHNEIMGNIRKTQTAYSEALKEVLINTGQWNKDTQKQYEILIGATDEQLVHLYSLLLKDQKKFNEEWEDLTGYKTIAEPFITALKTMGEEGLEATTEMRNYQLDFVENIQKGLEEAMEKNDVKKFLNLTTLLLGNPPVVDDPALKEAAEKYIENLVKEFSEAIRTNDDLSPSKRNSLLAQLTSALFGGANNGKGAIQAGQNLSKSVNSTITTYADATVQALDGIANAWERLMDWEQAALKQQLDMGEITQEEYDKLADKMDRRLRKSFDVLKSIRYASTVVNTAAGIMGVWADTKTDNYQKIALTVQVAAEGVAQLAAIASTYYNNASSIATHVPTVTAPASVSTIGLGELTESLQQQTGPIRAYVVDHDLANGLGSYEKRVSETSF